MEHLDENQFGEYPTLFLGSGKYKTETTKKFRNRKNWEAPNPKLVQTVIPGTIIDIFVKEGQMVKEGETVLILEAMKMQNQILMPFDGKIKQISVAVNQRIKKAELMFEIE